MKKESTVNNFGKKLAGLRKASGLTQQQLGDKIGVSKRVIAYYEGETKYPPAHLVVPLADALGLTANELLGVQKTQSALDPKLAALWRRLKIIETFSEKERRAVVQFVELIADRNKARQKTR